MKNNPTPTITENRLGEELRPKFESILNRLSRKGFDTSDRSIVHGEVVALFSEMYRGIALVEKDVRADVLKKVDLSEATIMEMLLEARTEEREKTLREVELDKDTYDLIREKNDWIWMPHAGHLIIGNRCLFHLSTFVNGYIVSTVGEYPGAFDRENGKFEEIGLSRLYETMVFKAQRDEKKACCPYTPSSWHELDFEGYNDAGAAREGHYALCEKYSKLSLNPKEGGTE